MILGHLSGKFEFLCFKLTNICFSHLKRFIAKITERTLNEYILICNSSNSISSDDYDHLTKLMNQNDDLVINNDFIQTIINEDESNTKTIQAETVTTIV